MKNNLEIKVEEFNPIYNEIKKLVNSTRNKVYSVVNIEMLNLYWSIGKIIVDKQGGREKAKYGEELIKIEEPSKRNFYIHETINSGWSVREL